MSQFQSGYWKGEYFPIYEGYLERLGRFHTAAELGRAEGWAVAKDGTAVQVTFPGNTSAVEFSDFSASANMFSVTYTSPPSPTKLQPLSLQFPWQSISFQSDPLEKFFGFGSRMEGNNQRGNYIYTWSEDGSWDFFEGPNGTLRIPRPGAAYAPMPWLLSTNNYSILVNTSFRTNFDLLFDKRSDYVVQAECDKVTYRITVGSPSESLAAFAGARGGAQTLLPPPYQFGPWKQMGWVLPNKTDYELAEELLLTYDVPMSLVQGYVHFFPSGSQNGEEPQLAQQNAALHKLGLASTCYFNPFVSEQYTTAYKLLEANGWFVKNEAGKPFRFIYKGGFGFFYVSQVDFSNPQAVEWYQSQIALSVSLGFDGFMLDYGEYTPINSAMANGLTGLENHNNYLNMYQKAVFDYFTANTTGSDYAPPFTYFARAGYTNAGTYTWARWTGDSTSDWNIASGLPAQITSCLSAGLSGIPYCGHDIGGYVCFDRPPLSIELLCRWVQFGAFSGIMRDETQGSGCAEARRTQILTSPETLFVWRKFAKLRTALFPYLYTSAVAARPRGTPLMRHLVLAFPQDRGLLDYGYHYMLGESLFVSPVVQEGEAVKYVTLPGNNSNVEWFDLCTSLQYDPQPAGRFRLRNTPRLKGGSEVKVDVGLNDTVCFVISGSIIPTLDPRVQTISNATDPRVTSMDKIPLLHLWAFLNGSLMATGSTYDGARFSVAPAGGRLQVRAADMKQRTLVWQMGTGVVSAVTFPNNTGVPEATWPAVAAGPPAPLWAYDAVASVLWLAFPPGLGALWVTMA